MSIKFRNSHIMKLKKVKKMNKKIFLDTDIGDDIDDALALIMLLKMNVDVVGISTVFKNTDLRARLAKKIVMDMGKNIPVYAGYGKPLAYDVDLKASFVQYSKELDNSKYIPDNKNEEAAIDAIIEACRKYQKDLIVLAIGPYTNIALAIKKDPEAFKLIDKIVVMGGCFFEQFVEYNVAMDPEAADIVMRAELPIHFISADVTWKVQLNEEQTKRVLDFHSNDIDGYCADLIRMWKKNCWFNPVLHDPLAAYYCLDESICKMTYIWSEVELSGEITRGFTANRDHFLKYLEHPLDNKHRILVSKEVDYKRFNDVFIKVMFSE